MKINIETLKKSKFAQSMKKFVNNNTVAKIIVFLIIWVIVSIPTCIYFLVRSLIDPFGFWEEIALLVAFFIGLGWLQGILLFFGIAITFFLICEDL